MTDGARPPLSRDRVVAAAVTLADERGDDAPSMRALADRLDVVPMALYKHVRNRDELLDAMVDAVVAEITPPAPTGRWQDDARALVLAARAVMLRHPWAWRAVETREAPSPVVLDHMEAMIRTLRTGGLSAPLVHHVMHALGSRLWGFGQEVFASPAAPPDGPARQEAAALLAARWPYVLESATAAGHDDATTVGPGCDDEAEFRFALDLVLDGAARLHAAGWHP
jgi:AcrR family transcriptional regulator